MKKLIKRRWINFENIGKNNKNKLEKNIKIEFKIEK